MKDIDIGDEKVSFILGKNVMDVRARDIVGKGTRVYAVKTQQMRDGRVRLVQPEEISDLELKNTYDDPSEWRHVMKWYYPLRDRVTETKMIDDARGVLEEVDNEGGPVKYANCLPRYFFTGDVKYKDKRFRAMLGLKEERVLRIIGFERLDPVYTLTDVELFKEAIRQIAVGA